jgi:hypothetical protein
VCIVLLLFSVNCFAESKFVINPKIEVGFQNDSNFWKSDHNEISVNTYYAKPGIVLGYETPRTQILLDATLQPYWYEDQDSPPAGVKKASDDNYTGFNGIFSANYQLAGRLNLGLKNQVNVTRDPAVADINSNSVNRDKYTINYLEPNAYYKLTDKFGLYSAYRNTNTDYEKKLEDSSEHRGILDLYYALNRISTVYLDYQVWAKDYDQTSSDYTSNLVTLNYERTFKYFSFLGGAGYHHRCFEDAALNNLDLFTWILQIKRMDADPTVQTTRSRLLLEVGQDMNNDGTGDDYYSATYVRFEGGYRLTQRIEVSGKAKYQNSDYDRSSENDSAYLLSGKLEYKPFDYLTLGIEGGYETRNSNLEGYDYQDRFILLTLAVNYDFGKG